MPAEAMCIAPFCAHFHAVKALQDAVMFGSLGSRALGDRDLAGAQQFLGLCATRLEDARPDLSPLSEKQQQLYNRLLALWREESERLVEQQVLLDCRS